MGDVTGSELAEISQQTHMSITGCNRHWRFDCCKSIPNLNFNLLGCGKMALLIESKDGGHGHNGAQCHCVDDVLLLHQMASSECLWVVYVLIHHSLVMLEVCSFHLGLFVSGGEAAWANRK